MTIRTIDAAEITAAVKKLLMDCNYYIGKDIFGSLEAALEIEDSPVAQSVLRQIIENDKIAADEEIPLCQDTGMAVLFVEYGDKVCVANGSFEDAVQQGVREAYTDGYLRKSVVSDPVFDRVNTRDNTPAVIHTKIVGGTSIRITAGGKGFGSENMSATPSAQQDPIPVRRSWSAWASAAPLSAPRSSPKKRPSVPLTPATPTSATLLWSASCSPPSTKWASALPAWAARPPRSASTSRLHPPTSPACP